MKNLKNLFLLLLFAAILMFSFNCKNDNNDDDNTNTTPVANFTVDPENGTTSTVFSFDASGSNDAETPVEDLDVRWDWESDGTWDTDYSTTKTANHQYSSAGIYVITLEVMDGGGLTATTTGTAGVSDPSNNPPNPPDNPSPANNGGNQELELILSWECTDPDGDDLTYDVFFGVTTTPPLISEDQASTNYTTNLLTNSTTYYWKIVATDTKGASTDGPLWKFTTKDPSTDCPDTFTDPRNGQTYNALKIGDQCWMGENLNIGTMILGSQNQSDNSTIEKYCYGDVAANCDTYGGLYQWDELMDYETNNDKGICPDGWHVPTDVEWMQIEVEVGMSYEDATSMGLRGTDQGTILGEGGSSGFEALYGGTRNSGGAFNFIGDYASFFSSTPGSQNNLAWVRYMFSANGQILRNPYDKTMGLSVRCVKDQ